MKITRDDIEITPEENYLVYPNRSGNNNFTESKYRNTHLFIMNLIMTNHNIYTDNRPELYLK